MFALSMPTAEIFVPSGIEPDSALPRTTHLAIGAHQDDLEIMAIEGILACYRQPGRAFTGVVVTDGRGAPRSGPYAGCSDDDMVHIRREEQKNAARIGQFNAQILLDLPSSAVKDTRAGGPAVDDLFAIVNACRAGTIYAHNLADKHDTHVAVALRTIEALRRLPADARPARLLGCEVWRDLDWLCDEDKAVLDASANDGLQHALLAVFDSQVSGGKRYDLAALGRRRANATFHQPRGVDAATGAVFAMDLTPLLHDDTLDPAAYTLAHIDRFREDVRARLARYAPTGQ